MSKKEDETKKLFKMLGEAILYGSIQFSIGSVEMSSKFSVKNFSKDQETLQNAADALMDYIKISFIWTLGVTLLLFSKYGWKGTVSSIFSNLVVVLWIYYSYMDAFKSAVKKNPSLKIPKLHLITPSVYTM